MQNMPPHSVVILFTDHETKNHQLENEIVSYKKEKDIDVIVVLAPKYSGTVNDSSWQVYDRVSQGKVFNMGTFNSDQLHGEVSQIAEMNCFAGGNLLGYDH